MYIDHVKIGNDGVEIHDSRIGNIDTENIVTGTSQPYIIWTGTLALYDAILTKDNSTLYFIINV